MPRPRKTTVDYFPHQCEHGKTMFILEQRYKNDGYAFWFKLLEQLGSTPGHSIQSTDTAAIEYMAARAHMTRETCTEILNLLASIGAIDADLWSVGTIWSDNFINKLSPLYDKRDTEKPIKPGFRGENAYNDSFRGDNTQTKVKETKGNKSKENTHPLPPPGGCEKNATQKYQDGDQPALGIQAQERYQILADMWTAAGGQAGSTSAPRAYAMYVKGAVDWTACEAAGKAYLESCAGKEARFIRRLENWLPDWRTPLPKPVPGAPAQQPVYFLCRRCKITKVKAEGAMCRSCVQILEDEAAREKAVHAGSFDSPGAKRFLEEVKKLTEAKSVRDKVSGHSGKYPCTECGKEHNDQPGVACRPCSAALLKQKEQEAISG